MLKENFAAHCVIAHQSTIHDWFINPTAAQYGNYLQVVIVNMYAAFTQSYQETLDLVQWPVKKSKSE